MRELEVQGGGRRVGRSRTAIAVAAFLLVGLAVLLMPRTAQANYFVKECTPGVQSSATDPFLISTGSFNISFSNECGSGSGYGLRLDAHGKTSPVGRLVWQVNAPYATVFKTADADVHYGTDDGYGPAMAILSGGYAPLNGGGGPSQWAHASQTNTDHFGIWLMCWPTDRWCTSNWAYSWSTNLSFEVQDLVAPQIAANGDLLDGGTVHGVQALQASATDSGGGVRSIAVSVNGVASKVDEMCTPTFAGGSYSHVKPCSDSSGIRTLSLDTQNDPGWTNGPNDVRICSRDAGGNESSPCLRRIVDVDNSCPGSGSQPAGRFEAGADVGGRLRSQASVRSTESPVIRGSLATSAGSPVAGATVCVYQTVALADASRELATTIATQPNGRFATKLEPGASRSVQLIYRYNTRTLEQQVRLDSAVVPKLAVAEKSVQNGHPVHFNGSVPGPNADERAVALQARVGRKWRTFKQLRTDHDGRFKGLYRFTQTVGHVRYTFRALVKRQGGYPYDAGASRKRKVVVRG